MSNPNKNQAFQMIADVEGDFHDIIKGKTPDNLPILPVRNLVLFPGVVSPILIGRDSSKMVVQKAEKRGELIGVVCQRDPDVDVPMQEDLYETGVFAKVVKLLSLPNGNITAIVQCQGRLRLKQLPQTIPYLEGDVEPLEDIDPEKRDREFKTAMEDLRNIVNEYINVSEDIPDEATFAIKNISNDIMALNFVCSNMPFTTKEKMKLLEMDSVKERLFHVMKIINREINLQNLKADIRNKTR
jgi:ATP-dependent Lon protease